MNISDERATQIAAAISPTTRRRSLDAIRGIGGRYRVDGIWADCAASTQFFDSKLSAAQFANRMAGSTHPLLVVTIVDARNPHAIIVLRKGEVVS